LLDRLVLMIAPITLGAGKRLCYCRSQPRRESAPIAVVHRNCS
jgi:hypothetical protein